jgi:hypothetical protein
MLLREKRPQLAWSEFQQTRHLLPDWQLPLKTTRELAEALSVDQRWEESAELWTEAIGRDSGETTPMRLTAAAILIERLTRPQAGLKLLQPIDVASLSEAERNRFETLRTEAFRQVDAGTVEFHRRH